MGEQGVQEGTKYTPLRGPSFEDVLLPIFTAWELPGKKSRLQLQREVFSLRVLSLVMSFEGTMVLNAELYMNSILTLVRSAIEMASSVDLLGWYAKWSGSRV